MPATVQTQIEEILKKEVPSFDKNEPLMDQLDSLQIMALVTVLENHFNVKFNPIELRWECLDDLAKITQLIDQKIQA